MLTQEELKQLLEYDPATGKWRWLIKRAHNCKDGWFNGHVSKTGYHTIRIQNKLYKCSRLAWLWMTGNFPEHLIDHIDGNKLNDCFSNLRDVPQRVNAKNRNNFVGKTLPGTCYDKQRNKYSAQITVDYKNIALGRYTTELEAHKAYLKAKEIYHC